MTIRIAKTKWLAAGLAILSLAGCGTNPVTGQRELQLISPAQEVQIGEQQYFGAQQMQGGDYAVDPALTQYVQQVGQRLAKVSDRELPYEFVVLDNSVPNAWSLPGGKIAVNRGLLQKLDCEAELAAVLGHEIVHAAARHGAKSAERGMLLQGALLGLQLGVQDNQYANLIVGGASLAASLITQKFGRDAERTSDHYGIGYMKRAGYDPAAAIDLQKTFVELSKNERSSWLEGLFASHPPSEERVENNRQTVAELGGPSGERGCERYQQQTAKLRSLGPAFDKYDQGVAALRKNDLATAQARANEALALAPKQPKVHELLGDVALERESFAAALDHYRRATELEPRYFKPLLASGVAQYRLDHGGEAQRLLSQSMELLPTATGAYYLGQIARESGNVQQALKYYELAAQSDSDIGRASQRELVVLDLPQNPARYVAVQPQLDASGRVWMLVQNRAPVPIENVVLAAVVANPAGGAAQGPVRVGTGQTLAPGEIVQIATPLGPLADPKAIGLVQAQVQSARVAR